MSLRVEFVGVALGVEMGIWAGAALAVLLGGFQLYEWLSCRKSPARRNATARNSFVAALVATVAGRRGLLDASIVSAGGLFMLGVGAPLSLVGPESAWRTVARFLTLGGLLLFGFGWPLCAALGWPHWLRPWFARDELAPWRGAKHEARLTEQEAWLESGSRVAEQERRVRERLSRSTRASS
jgi:hypothetical protein